MAQGVWQYALMNSRNTLRVIDGWCRYGEVAGRAHDSADLRGIPHGDLEADEDLLMAKALHAEG